MLKALTRPGASRDRMMSGVALRFLLLNALLEAAYFDWKAYEALILRDHPVVDPCTNRDGPA